MLFKTVLFSLLSLASAIPVEEYAKLLEKADARCKYFGGFRAMPPLFLKIEVVSC